MSTPSRSRSALPSRSTGIATAALAVVALLVLREPAEVLSLVRPPSTDRGVPGPALLGSVEDGVDAPGPVPSGTTEASTAPEGQASDEGRWGPSAPRPTVGIVVEEFRDVWRVEAGIEEAVALAVLAAHRWAADEDLATSAPGGGGAIVTVEAVERPGALHAVVTLLVASDRVVERLAVPVRLDTPSPALAGSVWRLPAPTVRTVALEGIAVRDAELIAAARAALDDVGIPGERLRVLEATDGWPFVARLDEGLGDRWLRWHVDRFVVAGLPLHHTESH